MDLSIFIFSIFLGLRHGFDSDHVAAIADMIGAEKEKKKQLVMGSIYAFGHGFIVFIMGILLITVGIKLSSSVVLFMEKLVGVTLLILGTYILITLFRNRKHEHPLPISFYSIIHRFRGKKQGTPLMGAIIAALVVGVIHGIGVESPTQIMIISNSVNSTDLYYSILQLSCFVVGIFAATLTIALLISWGFMKARTKLVIYRILGFTTGLYSLYLGFGMVFEIL